MIKNIVITILVCILVIGFIIISVFMYKRFKDIKKSVDVSLAFPIAPLPKDQFKNIFLIMEHTLSPLPEYHFQVAMAKDWKAIDNYLKTPIEEGDSTFHTIGLFQKRDSSNNPESEIEVLVARPSSGALLNSLQDIIVKQYGSHLLSIVETRQIGHGAQDVLFTYKGDGDIILVERMYLYGDMKGNVFMIKGTTDLDKYNQYADCFFAAMSTFQPLSNVSKNK